MGNREDLIAGAKRCLIEKGYARTTARDIAAASGVSLAAIGYHFGSKEALLNEAVYQSVGEWGEEIQHALAADGVPAGEPLQRFEVIMQRTLAALAGPDSGLWAAQLELFGVAESNKELRAFLARVQPDAAAGLAELFLGITPEEDPGAVRMAGGLLHALLIGIIAKWFMDPQQALSARELAGGLQIIAARMAAQRQPGT